ncbi:ABC transporter ATP-binding protein [Pelagibacterium luteolum]|uniref:Carbohydrate ABC transporter ATP-binding protein, CUT1 family n=1 Tax=Pelagibacterium luteolum TaxID=440168 RepID=A0A1G7V102_9HYPH|nr:ABC transporter ATP-binding protein [Pelagibacterium luteolum]SDG53238.1 carbohydrate ABC transporter ATP-binding protein, CUT1 family [Pelagibacterium luteolum]
MITISNLTKSFGTFDAVKSVDIEVPQGAFLVLVGPSGCGKSTMLRMLAGLETPTAGTISFAGNTVSDGDRGWTIEPAERNTGLVFQSYALWPHMTVSGNVEWPLKVGKMPAAERKTRVAEVLKLLGIEKLAARYPNEISGGQQQRVAIARMIAPRPGILLFDEPLSNLDAKLRVEMRTELLRVHRATGATSIYVTHDQVEAMTMASHVAVLKDGEVEQFGTPQDLVAEPRTAFVATFVGTPPANLIPVAPQGVATTFDGNVLPINLNLSGPAQAMYRPETLGVSAEPTPKSLALEFAEASPVAGRIMITGTKGDMRLTAVVDSAPKFTPGDTVHFTVPETPDALFAPNGERMP